MASVKCAKPSLCRLTRTYLGKFPSSPVVKTLGFYFRGLGFNHWSGNRSHVSQGKKKQKPENIQQKQYCNKFNEDLKWYISIILKKKKNLLCTSLPNFTFNDDMLVD